MPLLHVFWIGGRELPLSRSHALEKRRRLMEAWAEFIEGADTPWQPSLQRQSQSAQIEADDYALLLTTQLQNGAVLVS